MKRLLVIAATVLVMFSSGALAADYDVVILDGRVMDPETKLDAVRNVGIKDGKIAAITEEDITGKETIDASGHVVAPGFIDVHFHSLDLFAVKLGMQDGVTTGMDFEYGAWPIAEWYAEKEGNWPINFGTTVSHEAVRYVVHDGLTIKDPMDASTAFSIGRTLAAEDGVEGWSVTKSNLDQLNRISQMIDEGLREGACGLGSTVGYMTKGVTTYEMYELQRAAARYGRMTAVHTRFHGSSATPTEAPLAFDEMFTNAMLLDASLLISHDNDYGWWEIEEKLKLARAKGLNMWGEYYPYTAGSSGVGSEMIRPENWEDKFGYKIEETIFDPILNKYLTMEEYKKFAKEEPGRIVIVYVPPRKVWLPEWLKLEHFVVGGDGMMGLDAEGKPLGWDDSYDQYVGHPRTGGTHGKVLRLAREAGVPLMHTISQLSYWNALHLGEAGIEQMKVRGRIQKGMVADIAIFDPVNVRDNADYPADKNGLPTTGIPYVLVNGKIVVKDNKVQKVMAGVPIRYRVEENGRHVPLSRKLWLDSHTIDTSPLKVRTKPQP